MKLEQESMSEVPKDFIKPLQQSVVIKRVKLVLEGKILMAQTSKSITNEGYIMAVSDELLGKVEVGQRVLFNNNCHLWAYYQGEQYLLAHESDVYARIEEENGVDVLRPFNKTVLVEKGQSGVELVSGIFLHEGKKDSTHINHGTIIGLGEKVIDKIKLGDKVVFNAYADFCFPFRGNVVMCMAEADIFAVLPSNTYVGTDFKKERRPDIDLDKLPPSNSN